MTDYGHEYFVKWKGWDESFNSWVNVKDFTSTVPIQRYHRFIQKYGKSQILDLYSQRGTANKSRVRPRVSQRAGRLARKFKSTLGNLNGDVGDSSVYVSKRGQKDPEEKNAQ